MKDTGRAAIYCRLSKEDGPLAESESIANQKAMLTDFAQERGWQVVCVYCDEDYAGSDRERPAFRALLQDAARGAFDIVLCKTQSRFARDVELFERYVHGAFPAWGIRFISIVDAIDTQSAHSCKVLQIRSLLDDWYLQDLSENVRSVLSCKRREGRSEERR